MKEIQEIKIIKEEFSFSLEKAGEEAENYIFGQELFVYAVFDNGIALGTYKDEKFIIRFGCDEYEQTEQIYTCSCFPWDLLQELRVFGKLGEMRLRRYGKGFAGRTIKDVVRVPHLFNGATDTYDGKAGCDETESVFYVDEIQKLWGEITATEEKIMAAECNDSQNMTEELVAGNKEIKVKGGWSLIQEHRGSRIWVPTVFEQQKKIKWIGIRVRKYLIFPDGTEHMDSAHGNAQNKPGMIKSVDERLVGFCPWPEGGK